MSAFSRIEDPRVLTVIMTALVSAMLWVATWQSMSGMGDMSGMAMGGQSGGMSGSMSGMETGGADQGSMSGGGMASGDTAAGGMTMNGSGGAISGMSGMGGEMSAMMGMMTPGDWSWRTIAATVVMWMLMMAAMMLPSMAPVMSVYASVASKEDRGAALALRITLFALSYFLIWAAFSTVAALAQLGLRESSWFMMGGTMAVPVMGGALMIVAGAWQFTKLKDVCLRHCRHPLQYLLAHWKGGIAGAFPVGFRHGLYCFGCCVAFMGLMFVLGAMNVWWMAVIAVYFLAEKVLPGAEIWGKFVGGLLIAGGLAMIVMNL